MVSSCLVTSVLQLCWGGRLDLPTYGCPGPPTPANGDGSHCRGSSLFLISLPFTADPANNLAQEEIEGIFLASLYPMGMEIISNLAKDTE
jgi:hypothetical protein